MLRLRWITAIQKVVKSIIIETFNEGFLQFLVLHVVVVDTIKDKIVIEIGRQVKDKGVIGSEVILFFFLAYIHFVIVPICGYFRPSGNMSRIVETTISLE